MEPKLESISRKLWKIVRVAIFLIKKGLCKKKLLMDLNMTMKRGKIAGKALGNLLFHNSHHFFASQGGVGGPFNLADDAREYVFNCSSTPLYRPYFRKRKNQRHQNIDHFYMTSPYPLGDAGHANLEDINNVLEMMLRDEEVVGSVTTASPASPGLGIGWSPTVQQLRITDSTFSERDSVQHHNMEVDQDAEDFIKKFYSQLKLQK